jgi:hypothetical protein
MFGVDTYLFRGEITFDLFEIYSLDSTVPEVLGYSRMSQSHLNGLHLILFGFRITISLLLAEVVFAHFSFNRQVRSLLRSLGLERYQERKGSASYLSLLALRPLVEMHLIDVLLRWYPQLRKEDRRYKWNLVARLWNTIQQRRIRKGEAGGPGAERPIDPRLLALAALLRTSRARPILVRLARDPAYHPQIRLAALCSLARQGHPLPLADAVQLLELLEPRGGLADLDSLPLAPLAHDVLEIVRAYRNDGNQPEDRAGPDIIPGSHLADMISSRGTLATAIRKADSRALIPRLVAAAVSTDRDQLLWVLSPVAGQAQNILDGFGGQAALGPIQLDRDELDLLLAYQDLHALQEHSRMTGVVRLRAIFDRGGLGETRIRYLNRVLRNRLRSEEDPGVQRGLRDLLADLGTTDRDLQLVLGGWYYENLPASWRRLLAGIERMGSHQENVSRYLERIYRQRRFTQLQQQWLWSVLVRQTSPELAGRLLGLESFRNSLGMVLRRIPAPRPVDLEGAEPEPRLWAADFPVTCNDWQQLLPMGPEMDEAGGPDRPVVNITIQDTTDFCRTLSEQEAGADFLPSGGRYRLPEQTEWLRLASSGVTSPFWYGFEPKPELMGLSLGSRTSPSQNRKSCYANAHGMFSVLGNVWEWCRDEVGEDGAPLPDGDQGDWRIIRGGCGFTPAAQCTLDLSKIWPAGGKLPFLGFRVVFEEEG